MSAELKVLGVQKKPESCRLLCSYFSVGSGYVPDWQGPNAKVAFLLPHPTADDALNRQPMSGRGGESFVDRYLAPIGRSKDDCLFANVIRCRPKGNGSKSAKWGTPLTGSAKTGAESGCRHHDPPVLAAWKPDCYVLTFSLGTVYSEPAFTRLLQRDVKKAFDLADMGYRPLVLMGNEAGELFAPFIRGNGSIKGWRSHWQEMKEYPFSPGASKPRPVGFMPAVYSK